MSGRLISRIDWLGDVYAWDDLKAGVKLTDPWPADPYPTTPMTDAR
jgi:hypothetical protein